MRKYQNQRDPIDHQVNLETMHEMEEVIPMNLYERKSLHSWVYSGNDPEKNPWGYCDEDSWMLDYVHAYRRHHGYEYKIIYKTTEE